MSFLFIKNDFYLILLQIKLIILNLLLKNCYKLDIYRSFNKFHNRSFIDLWQVQWKLFNLSVVILSQSSEEVSISWGDEVDGNTFSTETSWTTDSVDVFSSVVGKIVVDDQVNLLDVDTSAQQISWNQNSWWAWSEFLHNIDSFWHFHITSDFGDNELVFGKLFSQLDNSFFSVGEDHALGDDHVLVKLDQSSELLTVILHWNVELFNTVQSQLLVLDQNSDWVFHELFSHFDNFWWHGSWEKTDLNVSWKVLENLSDFIDKSSAEHFISLIEDNDFQEVSFQSFLLDQIFYSAGGSDNDLNTSFLEDFSVFSWISASNTTSGVDLKEFTETEDDFVDLLSKLSCWGKDDGLTMGWLGVE